MNHVEQTTAKLSLDHKGERLSHHLAFAQTDVERQYFSNGSPNYVTDGQLKKTEYVGQFAATESIDLVFGGDGKLERVLVANGDDLSRFQLGFFGEAQLGFADRLFLTGGLRYDDNQDFGEHVSARITSALVQPLDGESSIKLRASAGNGFRAPSLQEIAYNQRDLLAETFLEEESSSGYDLGVEYFRESGLSAQISWFEQSIEDEIVFDRVTSAGYLQAKGRGHSKGVEIQFSTPVSRWAQLESSFTRNLTQTADDLPRIRRPGKLLNLSLYLYPVDNFVLLLNNRWERDAVEGTARTPLDGYEVLDMSLTYELVQRWEIFARVNNLLDENYQEVPGYNTSGRAAHVGTRFTF
jgi:vitamin B12 transporter